MNASPLETILNKNIKTEKTNKVFYVYNGHTGVANYNSRVNHNNVFITLTELGRTLEAAAIHFKFLRILNNDENINLFSKPITNYFKIRNIYKQYFITGSKDNDTNIRVKVENQQMNTIILTFSSDYYDNNTKKIRFQQSGIQKYSYEPQPNKTTPYKEIPVSSTFLYITDMFGSKQYFFDENKIPLTIIINMYKKSVFPTIYDILFELIQINTNNKLIEKFIITGNKLLDINYFDLNIKIANTIYITYKEFNYIKNISISKFYSLEWIRVNGGIPHINIFNILNRTLELELDDYNILYILGCKIINTKKFSIKDIKLKRIESEANVTGIGNILGKILPPENNLPKQNFKYSTIERDHPHLEQLSDLNEVYGDIIIEKINKILNNTNERIEKYNNEIFKIIKKKMCQEKFQ